MNTTVRPYAIPLALSDDVVSAPKTRGALRAHTQRAGAIVTVYPGGEIDAANNDSWRQLLREAAAVTPSPGLLVIHYGRCCLSTPIRTPH
jgi:hypothetical protein